MQRIAITGIGIVSPIGNDTELFEAALRLGRSGVGPNDWHDTEGYGSHRIGRVRDFTPPAAAGRFERRHLSTVDQYALAATAEARTGRRSTGDGARSVR
ncbi:MAG TPA: beta-ketoacyl synthase N-terminal-like domain-containing protein, partial [Plasticicumulans sp.]|nr:beta-ketoacyl synthase N-terminal-like domain-containing protein [Plasticicumulans sp.]